MIPEPKPPRLEVRLRDGLVLISWAASAEDFFLYRSATLAGPWQKVAQPAVNMEDTLLVTLEPVAQREFFRLAQ